MTYTISNAKELQQEKFLTSYTTTSIIPQGAAWREVISERYVPSNIVIQMGSKVTWTNEDKFPHTITSGNRSNGYDHKFNSGIIALNHSYSYVFSAPGIIRIIVSFIHG